MTCFAGSRWPRVNLAEPVAQPPSVLHSSYKSGPAARWIAPSTPPPPSKLRFAALTMASTSNVVMSATQTSSRAPPTSALSKGTVLAIAKSLSRPLGLRLRAQVDGRFHPDIVEVLIEKPPCRALAADMQHVEEIIVGRKLAESVEMSAEPIEHDAMHVDTPVLSGAGAARQLALIDQTGDEIDGAIFTEERGVERDLVDAIHDLARRCRRCLPHQRIDLHHQHILGGRGPKKWKDDRIAQITAIPIGHAVDIDGTEDCRQTCGCHDRFRRDLVARENTHPAGLHIGRRDEELQFLAGAQLLEIDEALDQILKRIDIERIDVVGRKVARHHV